METLTADGPASTSEWEYSGFWRRVAATVIDSLILTIPAAVLSVFTFGIGAIVLMIAYGTYFESSEQRATWGKQACGLKVETLAGARLSVGTALFRQVLKLIGNILSIIGWLIFFVPAAFTAKKQGLHDFAVSSVVRREPGKGIPSWLVAVIAGVLPAIMAIGILAAIAIPAYSDYVARARIAGARIDATPMRTAVEASFEATGRLPLNQSELNVAGASTGGAVVGYQNGRIEISLSGGNPGRLYLTPVIEANHLVWKCSAENIRPSQLSRDCR